VAVLAYLGPEGTFAHEGTDHVRTAGNGQGLQLVAKATVGEVIHDVDEGRCDYGLVPLENSIDGGVTSTIDVLVFEVERTRIREEVVVPVSFGAHRRPGDETTPATTLLSHPAGIAQCRRYAAARGLATVPTDSTSEACRIVARSEEPGLVAVASAKAAALAGLVTVDHAIEDFPGAHTRFALVAREGLEPSGDDKSTIVVTPPTEGVGILLRTLHPISDRGVNISEIVSRPLRQRLGEYCFLLTLDRHEDDPAVAGALDELRDTGFTVKRLGSYPAWRGDG
jgi:prephenate dehydratase